MQLHLAMIVASLALVFKSGETQTTCTGEAKLDLQIIVDSSGSVGRKNFNTMMEKIAKSMISQFDIGRDKTRVALFKYSSTRTMVNEFALSRYLKKGDLEKRISSTRYAPGNTMTAMAMKKALEIYAKEQRQDATKVCMVFTDGEASDKEKVPAASEEWAKDGVKVFAIGIGKGITHDGLIGIAGAEERVMEVDDYEALGDLAKSLLKKLCNVVGVATTGIQCQLEDNVRYFGFDMRNPVVADMEACKQICIKEHSQCVGFTYVKSLRECYLKTQMAGRTTDTNDFHSGICKDIDDCETNPCQNGGTCSNNKNGGYSCKCASGWTGDACDTDIDECTKKPCQNGGTCSNRNGGYSCKCANGWTGDICDKDVNECEGKSCSGRGYCQDGDNKYTCICKDGFTGNDCETAWDINECEVKTCNSNGQCREGIDGYKCVCNSGYTGKDCEIDINECEVKTCNSNGQCHEGIDGYKCECNSGYTGKDCEIGINECEGKFCGEHGQCLDGINGYTCACNPGYTGKHCEISLESSRVKCINTKGWNGLCDEEVGILVGCGIWNKCWRQCYVAGVGYCYPRSRGSKIKCTNDQDCLDKQAATSDCHILPNFLKKHFGQYFCQYVEELD